MSILKNKLFLIIAAAVLVIAIGIGIAVTVYSNTPENVAMGAISGVFENILEREEIAPIVEILKGGSVTLSAERIENEQGNDLLDGGSINGKVYFSKEALFLENIEIILEGDEISGNLYLSENQIYVEENNILGGIYAINFDSLADDFEDSIFAYGSRSKYAITDKKLYNAIIEALRSPITKEAKNDLEKISKNLIKDFWNIFCENVEFESETDEVRLNGEKTSARVVTITASGKTLASTIEDIYDYLLNDESIPEFLDTHCEPLYAVLKETNRLSEKSVSKHYETLLKEIKTDIKELCNELKRDNTFDEINIQIVTPKMSKNLLKLTVEASNEVVFSVDFGEDGIKKTNEINVTVYNDELIYKISKNDKKFYEATLEIDEEEFANISINKEKGKFELTLGAESENATFEGSYSKEGKSTSITLDGFTYYERYHYVWDDYYGYQSSEYTRYYTSDITLTLNTSDKIFFKPETYATIPAITGNMLDSWIDKIDSLF